MNNNRKNERTIEVDYEMESIGNSPTIKQHRIYNSNGTFETMTSEVIVEKMRLSMKKKREAYHKQLMDIEKKTDEFLFQYGRQQKFKCQLCNGETRNRIYNGDEALEKHLMKVHDGMNGELYADNMLCKLMGMSIEK